MNDQNNNNPNQARRSQRTGGIEWSDYLVARAALADPKLEGAAQSMLAAILDKGQQSQHWGFMSHVTRDRARQAAGKTAIGPDPGPDEDVFALLDSADAARLPRLLVSCGTEDHLADHSRRFAAAAEEKGAAVTLDLRPGEHEWGFWDTEIQTVLAWLQRGPKA